MSSFIGWLLDVYPNYEFNYITSWVKLAKEDQDSNGDCNSNGTRNGTHSGEGPDISAEVLPGAEQLSQRFDPKFYVYGTRHRLNELAGKLKAYQEIKSLRTSSWRIDINDQKKYPVLEVTMREYRQLKPFAAMIDREGKYSEFQLYNVDLRLSQKYMLCHSVFPLARISVGSSLSLLNDRQFDIDYPVPKLNTAELEISIKKRGSVVKYDDRLGEVTLGGVKMTGDVEDELLLELVSEVANQDPDIIFTSGGDSFVIPYLYHRAEVNGVNDKFQLGREHDKVYSDYTPTIEHDEYSADELTSNSNTQTQWSPQSILSSRSPRSPRSPRRSGKSYFTYGQIRYKPPFYAFKGRIHLDKLSSFVYLESGLYGLIELARLAGIPLQTMSRLSPGTAISSMQTTQALRDGVLVRWKKNIPEGFKDARTLLLADRGGHTFDPQVGVHDNVMEIDFASLYPNIISIKNISPETLLCSCCADDPNALRVPAAGYHICRRQRGLIPRVIQRILERRVVHKKRKQKENDMHDQQQKVLKWILVTCFGYTGYRNARFGRIECHESITAFAREILLDAMEVAEENGYNVLHGIVDSLWLTQKNENGRNQKNAAGFEELCDAISDRVGVNIEFEGYYRWIVFLPNKSTGVGALTRYYGLLDSGKFKVRGVEFRQRSTPKFFVKFQQEILDTLATANTKHELHGIVKTEALQVIRDNASKLLSGNCDTHDLVFAHRVTRGVGEYKVFNHRVAALMQLNNQGVEVHPGETVHYVVLNNNSKDPDKRVRVLELLDGSEKYDKAEYLKLLCRTTDSLLRPFGYTEERLKKLLNRGVQSRL